MSESENQSKEEMKTCLEFGSDRVLIHVDVVLVNGGHNKLIALRLHPCGDEGGQIQPGISVQHELVVYDLKRRLLGNRLLRHLEPAIPIESIIRFRSKIKSNRRMN